jgi:transposase
VTLPPKPVFHRNSPLSLEGRRRLVERCDTRPIAHVAAEMGISRACASKWVNRYRRDGEFGLVDRSSTPRHQPTATGAMVVVKIGDLRRTHKWSAARIAFELQAEGIEISRRTESRHLVALGLTAGSSSTRTANRTGGLGQSPRDVPATWSTSM